MKKIVLFSLVLSLSAMTAYASSSSCVAKAKAAAQSEYGNAPYRTAVKTIQRNRKYDVTVGIGNPEDGAHLFHVSFPDGCSGQAVVTDAVDVPIHPLQSDADAAYSNYISYDSNLPSNLEVSPSVLPRKGKTLYAERERTLRSLEKQWGQMDGSTPDLHLSVYRLSVDGQTTYAIWFPNEHDSIRAYVYLIDSKGKDIDQAAVYGDSSVGQNGVSWQREVTSK